MKNKEVYKNEDLVLKVNKNIDTEVLDLNKYEPFLEALCGESREFQKDAIREAIKFLLCGRYKNIRDLAEENYHKNESLQKKCSEKDFYGSLPLADKLNCSIDLATGTGKSYIIYGIAQIMLCEGAVDRVLVLCPSLTIEDGLTEKFEDLASNKNIKDSLPKSSKYKNPSIVNGTGTVEKGDICVENIHAVYIKNKSAIRDSFLGQGDRSLVLSDEAHHIYSPSDKDLKKWEQFLADKKFGFKYLIGLSGTCYIKDDYFPNVIYRYSLKTAIDEKYVKDIFYVVDEDETKKSPENVRFQEVYQIHQDNRKKYSKVKPLTILITKNIIECKSLITKFQKFLKEQEKVSMEQAEAKTLIITSAKEHEKNRAILKKVDSKSNKVEYIFSVSMLTEGWDVKNVFQIVPHEKRAFDSKLLISQVLGRGLRIPLEYAGQQPSVRIFNHAKWYPEIKKLVDEVLEREKRIYSYIIKKDKDYNFSIHNIDYDPLPSEKNYEKKGEYEFKAELFRYDDQPKSDESTITFVGVREPSVEKKISVSTHMKMYKVDYAVNEIKNKISFWSEADDVDYLKMYSEEKIEKIIRNSLENINEKRDLISESNLQKTLQGFGVIRRPSSKFKVIRFDTRPDNLNEKRTDEIEKNSISLSALSKEGAIYYDDNSLTLSEDNEKKMIKEVEDAFDEGVGGLSTTCKIKIDNNYKFRTPLNLVLVSHKPEREFVKHLIKEENYKKIDAWIKSRDTGFYTISYSWRKGEHPKIGEFNPDFFIKIGNNILIIETKSEIDISEENKGKVEYTKRHIGMLNKLQKKQKYYFWMISPQDYNNFFKLLREERWAEFKSLFESDLMQ